MSLKSLLKLMLTGALALQVAACAEDENYGQAEKNPHTGNEVFESEEAPDAAELEETGSVFFSDEDEGKRYVHATRLRVRSSASLAGISNVVGILNTNDEVVIMSEADENGMVLIAIVKSQAVIKEAAEYYTSSKYLSKQPQTRRVQSDNKYKYFMIQNIASEKMRIYEKRCNNGGCAHKMIFETGIAVGEDSKKNPGLRTIAGYYHFNRWVKFYQDGAGRYPSWYHPNYPMPPGPKKGVSAWTKKKVLPYAGAKVRGAFGWYTAFPGPNAAAQWTHGTLGWGADKDKYIKVTRGFWANVFADPRSHGCTRTDNESIAYVRSLLPAGTPLIKVYAKEAYADANLTEYTEESKNWNYILTKNGSREDGELADRERVLSNGTPKSQWLEEGTYVVDLMPSAKRFKGGKSGAKNGKSANVYAMEESDMNGVFLVDAGLLVNYRHPSKIRVGGYKDQTLPGYVISQSQDYTLPSKRKKDRDKERRRRP